MAEYTPNLNLLKKDPVTEGNDTFNIKTMLNENWDKIDQKVGDHLTDDVSHVRYAVATGVANTYEVTLDPTPMAYVEGMAIAVKINADSTGASTLNVNNLGAKSIKKANGTDATNLKADGIYTFRFDGTNFTLQGEGGEYGTADAAQVLAGYTVGTDGGLVDGTMPDNGAVAINPSNVDQTIAAGYHNGSGKVSKVTVDASKVLTGTTIAGTAGTMPDQGQKIYTPGTSNITIPAGRHDGSGYVKGDVNLVAANILNGKSIFGVSGSYKGYAQGSKSPDAYYNLTVTGLAFKPRVIIVWKGSEDYPWDEVSYFVEMISTTKYMRINSYNTSPSYHNLDGTTYYVKTGEFCLKATVGVNNWIAFA